MLDHKVGLFQKQREELGSLSLYRPDQSYNSGGSDLPAFSYSCLPVPATPYLVSYTTPGGKRWSSLLV